MIIFILPMNVHCRRAAPLKPAASTAFVWQRWLQARHARQTTGCASGRFICPGTHACRCATHADSSACVGVSGAGAGELLWVHVQRDRHQRHLQPLCGMCIWYRTLYVYVPWSTLRCVYVSLKVKAFLALGLHVLRTTAQVK
jgi:hypothetical protein